MPDSDAIVISAQSHKARLENQVMIAVYTLSEDVFPFLQNRYQIKELLISLLVDYESPMALVKASKNKEYKDGKLDMLRGLEFFRYWGLENKDS